mgnify:CR=1 FL=1
MKISLFLNTRKRVGLLNNLLSSLYATAHDVSNIEVFVTIDSDDSESKEFLENTNLDNLKVRVIDRPSNLNDDVIFRTYHWDKKIIDSYDPSQILYVATNDNSVDKTESRRYSSFPILTRASYEALGFFMSEKFVSHGGDVHLWRIFDSLGLVEYSHVFLDHVLHNNSQSIEYMKQEETAQGAIKLTLETLVKCWEEDISEDVERVREAHGV